MGVRVMGVVMRTVVVVGLEAERNVAICMYGGG